MPAQSCCGDLERVQVSPFIEYHRPVPLLLREPPPATHTPFELAQACNFLIVNISAAPIYSV